MQSHVGAQPVPFRWQCPQCSATVEGLTETAPERCPICHFEVAASTLLFPGDPQETQDHRQEKATSAMALIPGFEILGELGVGGMGVVYKARQLSLNRFVAIKKIKGYARKEDIARFKIEAEAVARLQHPNIVQIHEIGEHEGEPYFTLEYCAGGSLAKKLDSTPVVPAEAARLTEALAQAMHHAHQQGILHRDLKPANVLLQTHALQLAAANSQSAICNLQSTIPKITDFGLAKKLDDESGQTQFGVVMGTPSYMAPEQAVGDTSKFGPAMDIYALGAILYELLTGKPPFKAATARETMHHVMHRDPLPPRELQPATPRDLETICLKCLAKEPARRYASAQDLADDLRRFQEGQPIYARPVGRLETGWKWSKRHPAAAALIGVGLLVVAGVIGGFALDQAKTQGFIAQLQDENQKTEVARADAVTQELEAKRQAKEAEARRLEAEQRRREEEKERKKAVERSIRLTVATGQKYLVDGDHLTALLYYAEAAQLEDPQSPQQIKHQLRLVSGLAQCPRLVQLWSHSQGVTHVAFSPLDDWALSSSLDGTARVWDVSTGEPLSGLAMTHKGPINHAAFSPDSKWVATAGEDKFASVWDARTGKPIAEPLRHQDPVIQVAFSPKKDGPLLTVGGTRFATSGSTTSAPIMVPERIMIGMGPNNVPQYTTIMRPVSGGIPRTIEAKGYVQVWDDLQNPKASKMLRHLGWINYAEFSRDGQTIVTANSSMDKLKGAQVWDLNQVGKPKLMKERYHVLHASFSPDGKRVVSAGGRMDDIHGEARIWNALTGETMGVPLKHQGQVTHAWFSPDGKRILTASLDETTRVWDAETGEPLAAPLQHKNRLSGAWFSPDGRAVLTASSDGAARLWDAATGEPRGPILKHGSPVTCAAFSQQRPLVLTGCQDGTVRLWDLTASLHALPILKLHKVLPPQIGSAFTSHSATRTLRNVQIRDVRVTTFALFSPDGKSILTGGGAKFVDLLSGGGQAQAVGGLLTRHLCVWDAQSGELAFPPRPNGQPLTDAWMSDKGLVALLGRSNELGEDAKKPRAIDLVEIRGGRAMGRYVLGPDEVARTVAFQRDAAWAIILKATSKGKNQKQQLLVKEVQSAKLIAGPIDLDGNLEDVALSRDGATLATLEMLSLAGAKKWEWALKTWDLRNPNQPAQSVQQSSQPINAVVIAPDGKTLATFNPGKAQGIADPGHGAALQDSEVTLHYPATKKTATLRHKGVIMHVGFSPDGTQVVTTSADRTARVWDVATGKPSTPPLEHRGTVHYAEINSEGLVVTCSSDKTACLWDAATGEMISPPLRHRDWVVHASFRPDGRRLVTACCDGTARIWDLTIPQRSPEQWKELLQFLSGHFIDQTRGLTPLDRATLVKAWGQAKKQSPVLFTQNPALALAQHEDELEQAQKQADWTAALVHLEPLLARQPKEASLHQDRARALAELERWPEAEASYLKAKEHSETTWSVLYPLLLVQKRLGKTADADRTAEQLVKSFLRTDDPNVAISALRVSLTLAVPLPPLDDVIALTERFIKKAPGTPPSYLVGAAYYRKGKPEEAIKPLTAAAKSFGFEDAWANLFLALAHHRLNQRDSAIDALAKAIAIIDGPTDGPRAGRRLVVPWTDQLELHLLRAEVEAALKKK